jgi:soluble lytic murein transglycosylase-like protein
VKTGFIVMAAAVALSANAADFSASDVPRAHVQAHVVIRNDAHAITEYRFFGNVREALVTLQSSRVLAPHAFGAAVFNSNASVSAPMPAYLSALISDAAKQHGVDPRLVAAVARRESAFNPNAISRVGACGIMQLMPATARFLGVANVFDAKENVFGATRYLRTLLDTFHGDLDLTLAAYNAGPGAVQRYGGVPPFAETRAYVKVVRAEYERQLR